jgi:hypothetical protein
MAGHTIGCVCKFKMFFGLFCRPYSGLPASKYIERKCKQLIPHYHLVARVYFLKKQAGFNGLFLDNAKC